MDEFGVLVESIGFRAQGKSTPMAKLKPKHKPQSAPHSHTPAAPSSISDPYSLPVDQLDGIFRSNAPPSRNFFVDDDIFGGGGSNSQQFGGVDLETVLSGSDARSNYSTNSKSPIGFDGFDDFSRYKPKPVGNVDDLLGNLELNSNTKLEKKGSGMDDLMPALGGERATNRVFSETKFFPAPNVHQSKSSSSLIDDPFLVFESAPSWPFDGLSKQDKGKGSVQSPIDDLDDFLRGGTKSKVTPDNKPKSDASIKVFGNTSYVDDIFGGSDPVQQNNTSRSSSMTQNSLFDDFFHEEKKPEVKGAPPQPKVNTKEAFPAKSTGNDFTSLFGDITTSSEEFYEIDGEPEDRRRARLKRHMRTNERMAEALAEKNQRDLESQFEQEEKRRIAEVLEYDIKRWAAGKEGNIRALLSSLEQILWPESGWRSVSLTDMITSNSVKKVYKKATLYVHPDKVQQKGANLQQRYIAEKVFDILKEAWNKFSAEELR
ncbi:J domain-containing protein required for chloroplast accumulation response 1-like [Salvia splendens]|uniref:J domain-containing protein required for chloroplast accumulation response 1-like n=1 Tax=Salvia splendens TaxID=180675 RepID=UPI001C26B9E7|nr:J domain-containing protein required for chloroplast accumulation response 1-like [Salvia splendens]